MKNNADKGSKASQTADHVAAPSKRDTLRDPNHSLDGIQEYDNDMPGWWVKLFFVTIIFSAFYMAWYHLPFFPSQSLADSFDKAMQDHEKNKADAQAAAAAGMSANTGGSPGETSPDENDSWVTLTNDASLVASGKAAFTTNCAPCHGPLGGGLVGPNLTDDFWIHEPSVANLFRVVMDGVPEKGMPPWGPVIGPEASRATLAYIATLRGTNPPDAKAAEGTPQALP